MSEIEEVPVVSESNEEERMTMFFKLRHEYLEERKKILNQLYKKTKFMETRSRKN